MKWICFLSLLCSVTVSNCQIVGDNVRFRPGQCLPGDRHKELATPEPEGPDYQECLQWHNETCCTAEFTQILAQANGSNIDGFHWNRCGDLSPRCRDYFVQIECFYRCSPNVAHWAVLEFDSALANLPLCHDFCDSWFEACADDTTCAINWITDWLYVDGENYCKDDAECLSYRDVYGDGRGICSMLWGRSFIYSQYSLDDPERQCLVPHWPVGSANPNIAALKNMNISLLTGSAAIHVANVLGCIVGTIAVWFL